MGCYLRAQVSGPNTEPQVETIVKPNARARLLEARRRVIATLRHGEARRAFVLFGAAHALATWRVARRNALTLARAHLAPRAGWVASRNTALLHAGIPRSTARKARVVASPA